MRCRCRAEGLGYLFWEEILRKRRRGWEEGDRRGGKAGPGSSLDLQPLWVSGLQPARTSEELMERIQNCPPKRQKWGTRTTGPRLPPVDVWPVGR